MPLFQMDASTFLSDAKEALARLGKIADATTTEVRQARKAWHDADEAIRPTRALCDILAAARIEGIDLPVLLTDWRAQKDSLVDGSEHVHALTVLSGVKPVHFPVAFPEVFLREKGGFDVLLGNPPWKAPVVHDVEFWARYFPGLRGLSASDRRSKTAEVIELRPDLLAILESEKASAEALRLALSKGPFPGMGTGDPDLYKAFCWRFWCMATDYGGRIGVVLPRSALAAKGSEQFRWRLFEQAVKVDASLILNNRNWFFEDVHPQYTVGLVAIERGATGGQRCSVSIEGPYSSRGAYDRRDPKGGAKFVGEDILEWNDSASLPLLPSAQSGQVFAQLRKAPRLDLDEPEQWRARPYGEAHAGKCREFLADETAGIKELWPVFKGESFSLSNCESGDVYGFADPVAMGDWLDGPRRRRSARSAFSEFSTEWCKDQNTRPWLHPRVVVRDVTRATDTRTVITAVVPPNVFLTDKAPYFLFPRGGIDDQVYLYGILRSIPLDWYARRFVETGLKLYLINSLPIPRPDVTSQLREKVIELAARLAFVDERFSSWAREVGAEYGPLALDVQEAMATELDAIVAHLYGLSSGQLIHIFETFHEGWDYHQRLESTLAHFDNWKDVS